jgi:chromosomal replication initiation ATPase DnaA
MTAALCQLVLPFPHQPDFAASDFITAPSNAAALAWLDRTADWPGGRLALWGEAGRGKTHLLHRWADGRGARLLSGPALTGLPELPEVQLPGVGGVALDDADMAAEETALLHLLNAAAEAGLPVLLAGRTPPARWPVRLPDLASRLRAITAVEIGPPEDSLLRALLARLLSDRQLAVAEGVQDYLLTRLPRTPAALADAVRRLDRYALATGGAVTRALSAMVLAEIAGVEENEISAIPPPMPSFGARLL